MTREEAIIDLNALKFILNDDQYTDEIEEALDMAIEALQQPDHIADGDRKGDHLREATKKVDVISRQAAIDGADAIIARDTSGNNDVVKAMTAWKEYINGLPSAQPEQRWIPCSERLPELNSRCVLLYGNDNISGGYYRGNRTFDVDYGDEDVKTMVIAWMPLSEPYRKEGEAE